LNQGTKAKVSVILSLKLFVLKIKQESSMWGYVGFFLLLFLLDVAFFLFL